MKVLTCCNFAQTMEGKEVHSPDCPYMTAIARVEKLERDLSDAQDTIKELRRPK